MKHTIHKQILEITDQQEITLPIVSKFLSVQFQGGDLVVWYQCAPDTQSTVKILYILGTGHNLPENITLRHIGTCQSPTDGLVWHVYEGVQ